MTGKLEILCAGGFRAAMNLIAPEFEKAHGLKLSLTYVTPGETRDILEAGFPFDAGIVVASVLENARGDGFAQDVQDFRVAISPVGMGVAENLPARDVATLAAFRSAIGAFNAIGLSDPAAGTRLGVETLAHADRLGFGEEMRRKTRFFNGPGSAVSAAVARGEADAVITLSSEIKPIPGLRFIGRLPDEMQTEYAMQAIVPAAATAGALLLMSHLRSDDARTHMRHAGLEPAA